jgi:UDP-N-acetylmuramoyl-tripeptide--D-alanyl-D-alanine ligase
MPKGVILGDMLELGTTSAEEHQKVVDCLASLKPDFVLLVGPEFAKCRMPDSFQSFRTTEEAKTYLENTKPSGYYLLIKGSRGMKLESLVEKL